MGESRHGAEVGAIGGAKCGLELAAEGGPVGMLAGGAVGAVTGAAMGGFGSLFATGWQAVEDTLATHHR